MGAVYTITHRKSMLGIKVKLPDMKRLLPERAELVEAVSVNAESPQDNRNMRPGFSGKNVKRRTRQAVTLPHPKIHHRETSGGSRKYPKSWDTPQGNKVTYITPHHV